MSGRRAARDVTVKVSIPEAAVTVRECLRSYPLGADRAKVDLLWAGISREVMDAAWKLYLEWLDSEAVRTATVIKAKWME